MENYKKLQVFVNNCLGRIINIKWPDKIKNTDLWEKTKQIPVEQDIKKKKMAMDRAHVKETNKLYNPAGTTMESTRIKESGNTKKHLEEKRTHEMEKMDINSKTKPDWPKTGRNGVVLLVAKFRIGTKGLSK